MAIDSMWASVAAWFTPSVLFCAANLIIATIFFASNTDNNYNKNSNKHHDHGSGNSISRIARVSSFVNRARSMDLSSTTIITTTTAESQHSYPSQLKTANYSSSSRLAQSIYSSSDNVSNGDRTENGERQPLSQPGQAPSLFERVKSVKFSSSVCNDNAFPAESEQISDSSPQLVRAPSFLERVKSFRISVPFKSAQPENFDNSDHHVIRTKSETIKSAKKSSMVEMKKSRSEIRITTEDDEDDDVNLRRPATTRERRTDADEEVDAKADDFISRFKQQLKLQRLESLVRYNEMLNRGS